MTYVSKNPEGELNSNMISPSYRTGLEGRYGHGNVGDELMLARIGKLIRAATGSYPVVITCRPEGVHSYEANLRGSWVTRPFAHRSPSLGTYGWLRGMVSGRRKYLTSIRDLDTVVFGAGTLFSGPAVALNIVRNQVCAAKECGKRIILFGVGVSYIRSDYERQLLGEIAESCSTIYPRDQKSAELFMQCARVPPRIIQSADPLYGLYREVDESADKAEPRNELLLCPRLGGFWLSRAISHRTRAGYREGMIASFAGMIEAAAKGGIQSVLVPFWPDGDRVICRDILDRLPKGVEAKVAATPTTFEDFQKLATGARGIIAMPLHAILLGVLCKVPTLPVIYHDKCRELCREIGVSSISIENEGQPFPSPQEISTALDKARSFFAAHTGEIDRAINEKCQLALQAEEGLMRELRGRALDHSVPQSPSN
jgi:polysaccharide pyruvyl transferase WcaK-like protein